MGWTSPTGHNDPDSKWTNESNGYDDDTGTYAQTGSLGYYIEFTIGAINCDKIRHWVDSDFGTANIDVDVYYSSAWHNIFSGSTTEGAFIERAIGSTESVTKMRIKWNSGGINLKVYEVDFNDAGGAEPTFTPRIIGVI